MRGVISRTLVAFRIPSFSWLWATSTIGIMAFLANSLTMGWLVLELTDSPFWVGAAAATHGIGMLGFGVFAGVLIDRLDRRRMLIIVHILNGAVPLLLGLLVLTDRVALWHILVGGLLQGMFDSIHAPTINTITYQMVGPERMLNASAAIALGFNLASVVASAVAGALISQWDVEGGLLFAAACFFLGAATTLFIRGLNVPAAAQEPFLRAAAEGVRYAWTQVPVRRLLFLSVIMEMCAFSYFVMLPVVARDVLRVGASGLGLLSSMGGVGATLSTLWVASLGDLKNKSSLLVFTVVSTGLSLVLFGLSRWYALSLVLVILLSASLSAYDVTIRTVILLVADDKVRGRVQSIYTLTFAFMSFGGFVLGGAATIIGAPLAISVSGGIVLSFVLRYLRPLIQRPPGGEMAQAAD